MTPSPQVSVVVATYNRSNILRYALASVVAQTVRDWELIVIGDCCTDDTEAVVAELADPRIRFVNLPTNVGEQSGPNNHGLQLCRGRFIAFLNHDDLWFPDHLERMLHALEDTRADLVFPVAISRFRRLADDSPLEWGVQGASPDGRLSRFVAVPASLWVFRRELADRIGPWRAARECRSSVSSRDWLDRAASAGADIRGVPFVTVFVMGSTIYGPGSYARRDFAHHRDAAEQMTSNPDYRAQLLTAVAVAGHTEANTPKPLRLMLRAMVKTFARGVLAPLGTSPAQLIWRVRYRRADKYINRLRRHRGLTPLPQEETGHHA